MSGDALQGWEEWELALAGEDPDEALLLHLLRDPDEYQLRRVLRTFEHRDELLSRVADSLWGKPASDSAAAIERLAAHVHEQFMTLNPECSLSGPELGADREPADDNSSESLLEPAMDQLMSDLGAVPGGLELLEVIYGACSDYWLALHILQPLSSLTIDLQSYADLNKLGCRVWVESERLFVSPEGNDWRDRSEWTPELTWPTEEEVELHRRAERESTDPKTAGSRIAELLDSPSTLAARAALQHPNLPIVDLERLANHDLAEARIVAARHRSTPPEVLASLVFDVNEIVRRGIAVNPNTPAHAIDAMSDEQTGAVLALVVARSDSSPAAIERARLHPDGDVRAGLARNETLTDELYAELAADEVDNVRFNLARNNAVPLELVQTLLNDDDLAVRAAAEKAIERRSA